MVREKYSTEETVIGEWEDENGVMKPLYRRMIKKTFTTSQSWLNLDIDVSYVKRLTECKLVGENGNFISGILTKKASNNTLDILCWNVWGVTEVILEYTKTTD